MSEVPEWVKKSQVGDKVVCIDTGGLKTVLNGRSKTNPQVGSVYTIREIVHRWAEYKGVIEWASAFLLSEIVNGASKVQDGSGGYHIVEPGFDHRRFKPLTRKPTDISIFTDMLVGSKTSVNA